jgi:tetratricopeptide (TPR) repeat protein
MTLHRPRLGGAALLALFLLAVQPQAWAQQAGAEATAGATASAGQQADVAAGVARSGRLGFLYYLASRNDYARLNAEIEQLKKEDPSWTPPTDLFDPQSASRAGIDDTRFWEAYSHGDLVTAKREMTILRQLSPAWRFPPEAVDLTRAWAAFESGDYAATRRELKVMQDFHEGMEIPAAAEILDLVADAESGNSVSRFWAAYKAGDLATAKREMETLKRVAPSWRFPPDAVDTRRAWAAYQRGDYTGARREVESLQDFHEGWTPPADLMALIESGEVGQQVSVAVKKGDWLQIIRLHERSPGAFGCGSPDNAWAAGKALWSTGQRGAAGQLFANLVDTCDNADIRVASILVSEQFEDLDLFDDLIRRERPKTRPPVAERTFGRALADREAMAKRAVARRDAAVEAALYKGDAISPDQLEATIQQANSQRNPKLAMAIAWNAMNRKDFDRAGRWFETALQWANTPEAARGLILVQREQGQLESAISLARTWAPRSAEIAAMVPELDRQRFLTLDPKKDAARILAEYPKITSPDAATRMHRGWALVELKRYPEALNEFTAAMRDGSATGERKASAQAGAALAAALMGNTDTASQLTAALPADQQTATRAIIEFQRAIDAYEGKRFEEALIAINRRRQLVPGDTSLDPIEAWSLFRLERYDEARQRFRKLAATTGDPVYKAAVVSTVQRQQPQ